MIKKQSELLEYLKVVLFLSIASIVVLMVLSGIVVMCIAAFHLTNTIIDYWWINTVIGDKGLWVYISPGYISASIIRPILWILLFSVILGAMFGVVYMIVMAAEKLTSSDHADAVQGGGRND
ncbi:hypothetical protein [Culicoidibacter larvae]|uniref:Uncharacterized protein n=1 Tax=Culicoidibacter larvae TaxID=2579976 RepID=A0A5R8Q7C7_9FIRM|nr:hypothetical protein [Culicoidibacter larvae]TLG70271.1 hypothetical protein FEZ08_12035 [Culicoidibacter larvae]